MTLTALQTDRAAFIAVRGCKYPKTTVQEAARVGLPLSYALALLEKESSGKDHDGDAKFGLNLFGHDAVRNPVKGGFVTRQRYEEYLRHRRAGLGMQGVGPCQLTWFGFQDAADKIGGCWVPRANMRVGFAHLKALINQYGKQQGARRYNGSGARAEAYARDWLERQRRWHDLLEDLGGERDIPVTRARHQPERRDGERPAAPGAAAQAAASRPLRLREPLMEGPDIRALQTAINAYRSRAADRIGVDGVFGERTDRTGRVVAWHLGAAEATLAKDELTVGIQRLILGRLPLTEELRERALQRKGKRAPQAFGDAALPAGAPRIVTASMMGLGFRDMFGALGPELHVTGHYTAGPRARNAEAAVELVRTYHAQHMEQGWGGIGYHYLIADDGTLLCARPTNLKGAHTGGHNSNNIGVCCPATSGDRPTAAQRAAYRWLLANAHTAKMPKAHRTDRDLRNATRRGHKEWPGNPTACPGLFLDMYKKG